MNIQEMIVCAVVFVSFLLAARRIIHYFNRIREKKNICEGCSIRCMCSGKANSDICSQQEKT